MFYAGDMIIYGSVGVCKVEDVDTNSITGVPREYYILRPVDTDRSIIYVPTDNEKLTSKMHPMYSKKEMENIISDTSGRKIDWVENDNDRSEKYRAIVSSGKIDDMIMLFRTLHDFMQYRESVGKRLPRHEEIIYKDVFRILSEEFSTAMKLSSDEMISLLLCEQSTVK